MTKRVVQFIAILLILVLHIGGVLNVYASIASPQKQTPNLYGQKLQVSNQETPETTDADFHLNKGKKTQHPLDEGAYEKVEESDSSRLAESNFPFPLLADLLQQTITFSLFPLLYNNKQLNESTEQHFTCFDGEMFILYQDFRI